MRERAEKSFKNSAGFTLAEILVVIVFIIIISAVIFINYKEGQQKFKLDIAANKLAQDIRLMQEKAMASEEFKDQGVPEGGFGIYLRENPENQPYNLFADIDNDGKCSVGSERIEEVFFEEGIALKSVPGNHFNIIFLPPDPKIIFTNNEEEEWEWELSEVEIVISLSNDQDKTKSIKVNKAGLITVE